MVPILLAEEVTQEKEDNVDAMWTFYKLSTIWANITIRWLGESNGYYSIGVNFNQTKEGTYPYDTTN